MGKPGYVQPDWIKPGAAVIDVGTNRVTDAKQAERLFRDFPDRLEKFRAKGSALVGDVHPAAINMAGALTPVPGGVGPMTITMLMSNTVKAARLRRASPKFSANAIVSYGPINSRSCSDSASPVESPAAKAPSPLCCAKWASRSSMPIPWLIGSSSRAIPLRRGPPGIRAGRARSGWPR